VAKYAECGAPGGGILLPDNLITKKSMQRRTSSLLSLSLSLSLSVLPLKLVVGY